MQVEVGSIVEGVVTGIMEFGAFVKLPTGESGMVHISEIANSFVADISTVLQIDQIVSVKVLGENAKGKISLSIKQALPPEEHGDKKTGQKRQKAPPNVWKGKERVEPQTFDEMMSAFIKDSEDKISDLKKASGTKSSSYNRRNKR
ncbi:MAG TPA: S1 RNA-binding domain-containing protein [Clostridiales bacterium]|nr:S1 RNA-binding domain-containing protein [Clostridiales bacterium]